MTRDRHADDALERQLTAALHAELDGDDGRVDSRRLIDGASRGARRIRRRRQIGTGLLAVLAVAAIPFTYQTLQPGEQDNQVVAPTPTVEVRTPAEAPTDTPDASAPAESSPPPDSVVEPDNAAAVAEDTVRSYLDALVQSGTADAYALLTPQAQQAVGGLAGLESRGSALAEGAAAPVNQDLTWAVRPTTPEAVAHVVIVYGEAMQEGMSSYVVRSFVVRDVDGTPRIDDILVSEERADWVVPEGPAIEPDTLEPGADVQVVLSEDAVNTFVSVDDGDAPIDRAAPPTPVDGGLLTTFDIGWLDPGTHVVTVSWNTADPGPWRTSTLPFVIREP